MRFLRRKRAFLTGAPGTRAGRNALKRKLELNAGAKPDVKGAMWGAYRAHLKKAGVEGASAPEKKQALVAAGNAGVKAVAQRRKKAAQLLKQRAKKKKSST
jgi:hypothetical protein